eukprot:4367423-Amphidinium_carterae.1
MCRARGEVPVGEGALDETFDLAFKTEARNASRQHQADVFLELLAVVRALEECQPRRVVSDCKGVVKALQAIQSGHRMPKGRHRDLE